MTIEQRIGRLERVVLGLAAMLTGEAQAVTTAEELATWQEVLGRDLQDIANEQR
jgi:hypothetical protein